MPFKFMDYLAEITGRPPRPQATFEPPRLTPLRKPIAESTIGVFASCGVRHRDQPPLEVTADLSYRLVEREWPLDELVVDHEAPVRVWAEQDLNVAYPRDRLVELEAEGAFARLAPRAVSMVGSITQYTPLLQETVPRIKEEFESEGVDLVWLFPF